MLTGSIQNITLDRAASICSPAGHVHVPLREIIDLQRMTCKFSRQRQK